MMNSGKLPSKRSRIERIMNKILLGLLVTLILFSVLSSILSVMWEKSNKNAWYSKFFLKIIKKYLN